MFKGLRYKWARARFNREIRQHKRTGKVINLDQARSIGILYVADGEETVAIIKKYVKYLKEDEGIKKILAIGLYTGREKKLPGYLTVRLEFDFINPREHIKSFRPVGNISRNFISEEFDILLDLTFDKHLPLMHLLSKSNARFKVGVHTQEYVPCYDLMVITNENRSLTDLIDNINTIIKKINKPQ